MGKKRVIFVIFVILVFCLSVSHTLADTIIISVAEDEMVQSQGVIVNNNFNSNQTNGGLCTGSYISAGGLWAYKQYERFYLKFNLSTINPNTIISTATLYGYYNYDPVSTANRTHDIYLSNDNWSVASITWQNQPGPVGQPVAQFNPASATVGSWQSWDVTNVANQEYLGDGILSLMFMVSGALSDEQWYQEYFAEKEFNPDLAFRLEITTFSANSAVPIPSSVPLFGSGLLGLAGWRRLRQG